ncbi:hypothetical protein OJF2_70490 [Aquisphaera giovannonii]|uniref:Glucose/Sorbosone dehydrogenase domain-containing protein n=1 Tax=Aquisphaera giovannonii TaxID=406548 RepID=A0A5B9WCW5_9BACT|nr:hypothetical protein [Aquisphaera giovannonii]QEH38446.1 hypothetical protein OJF2_70490 [Aquisphaera giovannonii]
MAVIATRTTREGLRKLPTTARPILDAADVLVPEGYAVEPVLAGLSFPCGMGFADDGSLFLLEGGSTWPTRPYMPARILRLDTASGGVSEVGVEVLGGPRGVSYRDGAIYVTVKGGYHAHVDKYDLKTNARTTIVDGLPSGGWHEPSDPMFGPDGLLYFGNGSVSQNGVSLPQGFTVDLAKHPEACDVPGQDVTLTGNNVWSRNPTTPFPFLTETGPFKPFGQRAQKGEVIRGRLKCSSGLWRCHPDGSGLELLAWGLRNPYGLAFSEAGELYATDNDYEEKGERAIAEDPDRIWHIRNAKSAHGSVRTPDWYGFPDLCGDGVPAWDETRRPRKGKPAEPLIADRPAWAGPAAFLEKPHTCECHMDFCRSDAFGHRGHVFLSQFGTYAPLNTPDPAALDRGFCVKRIDLATGENEPFVRNRQPGPASHHPGSGGIERPVDCKFHPDGRSLYVLDFGVTVVAPTHVVAYARTGALWRVTKL